MKTEREHEKLMLKINSELNSIIQKYLYDPKYKDYVIGAVVAPFSDALARVMALSIHYDDPKSKLETEKLIDKMLRLTKKDFWSLLKLLQEESK